MFVIRRCHTTEPLRNNCITRVNVCRISVVFVRSNTYECTLCRLSYKVGEKAREVVEIDWLVNIKNWTETRVPYWNN